MVNAMGRPLEKSERNQTITTTVSDVIIAELEKWGITLVFGIPGGSSLGLVDSIRRNTKMRYIVVRHEQAAAFAASAYNKLTGKLAACLTIAGPGATNLATGLYDAKEDSASVLSLNGQVEAQYVGPGGFQEIDQDAFFRPITIFNNTIYEKTKTLKIITMALKYAVFKKGVAQVSIPNDLQKEVLDAGCCEREMSVTTQNILPEEQEIEQAATVINQAKKPVILAGWGAFQSPDWILKIAQKLKAPIVTTFRAKGIIPENNEWVLGILGDVGSQYTRSMVNASDLLITLGVGFSKRTNVPFGKPLLQVDIDPIKLGKYPFQIALLGNCNLILPRLYEKLDTKTDLTSYQEMTEMKRKWNDQLDKEADPQATPIRPPYIMKILSETLPEDAVITIDVGENGWWFGRNFVMKKQRFAMSGYLATMGFALPSALAAKLAYPKKTVVCITGDGGFSMAMGDFVTAVKYELPMSVIVLNNKKLAMIELEQQSERFPAFGVDLLNPNFAAYANACGGIGIAVDKPQELRTALQQALTMNVPTLLDVDTDPRRF